MSDSHDPVATVEQAEGYRTKTLFKEIARLVPFSRWAGRLKVYRYRMLLKLAVMDLYVDEDEDAIATRAGLREASDLEEVRKTAEYAEMLEAVEGAFVVATTPQAMKDHVAKSENQDRMFRALMDQTEAGGMRAMKALEILAERAMPVQKETGQQVFIVQPQDFELINQTLEEVRRMNAKANEDVLEIEAGEAD